jgi:hypothetical protein
MQHQLLNIKARGLSPNTRMHPYWTPTRYMGHRPKIGGAAPGGVWKPILFWWFRKTLILVDHETTCVRNLISLAFHAYVERPYWRWYSSYPSIWNQGGPWLRVGLKARLYNTELDWISILVCTSPWFFSTSLMPRMFSSSSPWSRTIIKLLGSNWFSR